MDAVQANARKPACETAARRRRDLTYEKPRGRVRVGSTVAASLSNAPARFSPLPAASVRGRAGEPPLFPMI